jgi:Fuc2NAc and GlcNAc transferase
MGAKLYGGAIDASDGERVIHIAWLITILASSLACAAWLYLASRWQLYDLPNERSAHKQPIPGGGGVGLLLGLLCGVALYGQLTSGWPAVYWQLLGAASVLALIGLVDDIKGLPVLLRFLLYAAITLVAIEWQSLYAALWISAVAAVYVLWMLNLYNFMDGIDGLAASEACFVCLAAALLSYLLGASEWYSLICLFTACACMGFLYWNWSPARLFMGDTGSIALGFLLAMLSLLGTREGGLPLLSWLILLGVFITDASYTLVWRIFTGQAFTEAHSLHLYQRLSRHWDSHARVGCGLAAVNLFWLLPIASLAAFYPEYALWLLVLAYAPLLFCMAKMGKFT